MIALKKSYAKIFLIQAKFSRVTYGRVIKIKVITSATWWELLDQYMQ